MVKYDTITLVAEPVHGVFEQSAPTETEAYATIKSVSRSEFYTAKTYNIEPEVIFELSQDFDYNGQRVVLWRGERWRVIRNYIVGDAIELVCGKAVV